MKPHRLDRAMGWRASVAAALAVGGLLLAPSTGTVTASSAASHEAAPSGATTRVIVTSQAGQVSDVGRAALDLGGRVVATQANLGTVVVDLPEGAADALRAQPGVQAVTADSRLQLLGAGYGPTGEDGDMANVARLTGATTFWKNGFSGQGVDVALLDSGVLPVEGLTTTNKLVIGPDLSFESQEPTLRSLDTFGHGTHMAGIIAGRDSGASPANYTDNSKFMGMAPGARVVSLKLADAQGNTDVSQVLAAIDWVVTHAKDPGLNIRVLNLSFGTDSSQSYQLDPLAHAAEVAWNRGIVVVVSAGNGDGTRSGLSNPAYDPAVLAVGAVNTKGTPDRSDDNIPAFSQRGNVAAGERAPDIVAPGVSVVSLRAKNSFADLRYASTAAIGDRFFKGSGTSQSAAVVSGAVSLLLSQRPTLSPDQVKDILRRSAQDVPGASVDAQGAGSMDLTTAYGTSSRSVTAARVHSGGGSLDKARGTFKVKKNGVTLEGEKDIFLQRVDSTELAEAGSNFTGATWAGGSWKNSPYLGATWAGSSWAGATWAGSSWAGATWAGATWAGSSWAGATWAGSSWAGATWAGATWADAEWANALWSSARWE